MLVTSIETVETFVDQINLSLGQLKPNGALTRTQTIWLSMVLVGIIMTERLCWALFERRGFKTVGEEGFRWMFYRAKIQWHILLKASVKHILKTYGVNSGVLVIDDTDKKRTKTTSKI